MYQNIGVDWNAFDYIFSGKTQAAFEQLAYILFCHEFNQQRGIFRYLNQSGIETDPIEMKDEIIGFQAKYYEAATSLSSKVKDFNDMVDKSKSNNPELSKIHVYVNKEFKESSTRGKKKPEYQDKIEDYAEKQGIEIVWRVPSNIEIMLFSPELPSYIKDFFFNSQQGIRKFIESVASHTITLVDQINSSIEYKQQRLIVEHERDIFPGFLDSSQKHFLIFGTSGTGKSGLVRDFYKENSEKFPIFFFKATDFGFNTLSEFSRQFGENNIEDFFNAFEDCSQKVLIIDSAERVFSMERTILNIFMAKALKHNWKIIHTIRTSYKENYLNLVLETNSYEEYHVEAITKEKVQSFFEECCIEVPVDIKLRDLLCNLFYLDLYIRIFNGSENSSETRKVFLSRIWDRKVKGLPEDTEVNAIAREELIFKMFRGMLNSNSNYYLSSSHSHELKMFGKLKNDGIIDYDEVYKGYFFAHDIYEELVAQKLISNIYSKNSEIVSFYDSLDMAMSMRKNFRMWLHDRIVNEDVICFKEFIIKSLTNDSVNKLWKDEILVALMDFENVSIPLVIVEEIFIEDNNLLYRAIFLLNAACKVIDYDFASEILTEQEITSRISQLYRFTKPSGRGWEYLIEFIYQHLSELNWDLGLVKLISDMISSWVRNTRKGTTTKFAGMIALYLYDLCKSSQLEFRIDNELKNQISSTILNSAFEIQNELTIIFKEFILSDKTNRQKKYYDLVELLLKDTINCSVPCEVMPEIIFELCKICWIDSSNSDAQKDIYGSMYKRAREDIEKDFGLKERTCHDYFPTSGLKTPIFLLLQHHYLKTFDFILEIVNISTEKYLLSQNESVRKDMFVELKLDDETTIRQISSTELWLLHRSANGPYLLECVLMALERWLLYWIPKMDVKQANNVCVYLLSKSKSVAITSVINSVVLSNPEKLFDIACTLLTLGEPLFEFENNRYANETTISSLGGIGIGNRVFIEERVKSNKLEFRNKRLEDIIIDYQISSKLFSKEERPQKIQTLYDCLDVLNNHVETKNITLRRALNRIDLRKLNPDTAIEVIQDGEKYYILQADEEEDLKAIRVAHEQYNKINYGFLDVSMWARRKFENKGQVLDNFQKYETEPLRAFEEMKELVEKIEHGHTYNYLINSAPLYISSVLLSYYKDFLSDPDEDYCKKILLDNLDKLTKLNQINQLEESKPLVEQLPYLISDEINPEKRLKLDTIFLIALFLDFSQKKDIYKVFSEKMWQQNPEDAEKIFKMFILLKNDFDKSVRINDPHLLDKFIKKNKKILRTIFFDKEELLDLDNLDFDHNLFMEFMMLLDKNNIEYWNFLKDSTAKVFKEIFEFESTRNRFKEPNYELEETFIFWLSKYVYHTGDFIRSDILRLISSNLQASDHLNSFLTYILFEHDKYQNNTVFWKIWNGLYKPIVNSILPYKKSFISSENYPRSFDNVVSTYCFAWQYWGEKQKEWFGVKLQNIPFFDRIVKDLGFLPVMLFSMGRFLNSVGSSFIKEGIGWLSILVSANPHLIDSKLKGDTVYYIEEVVIRVSRECFKEAKKDIQYRQNLLIILNFLVSRGSTIGFIIREDLF